MESGRPPIISQKQSPRVLYKIVIWLSVSLGIILFAGVVVMWNYHKTHWTKQEAIEWYALYGSSVRGGVQYEGSDQKWHYFTAGVMDDTCFLAIRKIELKMEDELPPAAASGVRSYYAVDPSRNFRRIEERGTDNKAR